MEGLAVTDKKLKYRENVHSPGSGIDFDQVLLNLEMQLGIFEAYNQLIVAANAIKKRALCEKDNSASM